MAINTQLPLSAQPLQLQMPDPNSGMNALARAMQIKSAMSENDLNALKMDEYKRGLVDQESLRNALSQPGADPYNALLKIGKVKEATDYAKGQADIGKTKTEAEAKQIEIAHKRVDSWGQAMGWLRQNPTPENAVAAVQHLVTMGIMPEDKAQAAVASIQSNPTPQGIAQFADMGFRTALQTKDQLPKFQTNNIGGQTVTQQIDPVTGQARVASAIQNTQSPDNAASVAATMRGQNMVDARARETNNLSREANATVYDSDRGLLVNKGTGAARPALVDGQPVPKKPSAAMEKELLGINQQNAIIDGAIQAAQQTPSAFGMRRGMATLAGSIPESIAGRMDSDAERQARSYVFNNVSKIINERAGAAQSAQELARLRSFLPAETDTSDQITSKLTAFKRYLGDLEAGTRGSAPKTGGASGGWSIQKVN